MVKMIATEPVPPQVVTKMNLRILFTFILNEHELQLTIDDQQNCNQIYFRLHGFGTIDGR